MTPPLPRQVVFLASIDWHGPWQRHQSLATSFAQNGLEVFFVENTGFRNLRLSDAGRVLHRLKQPLVRQPLSAGIHLVSPTVLPPTNRFFHTANHRLFLPTLLRRLRGLGLGRRPMVFAYLPTSTTLELLRALEPDVVVYDCVDNFQGHPTPPRDLDRTENKLLEISDLVLTTSPFLYERHRSRHGRVHELHHGASEEFFLPLPARLPSEYRKFCYFGTLWSAIDYEPVAALARAGFEVTLIGPVKEGPPPLPPSVRLEGALPPSELARALSRFDALLLPYADTPYNQGVTPAKTYECLATGKPALASPLPGLSQFQNVMYFAETPSNWVELAQRLPELESPQKQQARIELARDHSTRRQFDRLLEILRGAPRG